MKNNLIKMEAIKKSFNIGKENELEILHGINFDVNEGEFVSVVGQSGSGKSTLMNIIGLLDRQTSGYYELNKVDISKLKDSELSSYRSKKIGFVFQNFNLIPRSNALKNVELPMTYAGIPKKERAERAERLLEIVDMKYF